MARILLVEDDPVLGRGLHLTLKAAGHDVIWETKLAGARAREASGKLDLIVLDVNLPDGSGLDLCREIRDRGSRLPIVMLTARTDEDSVVAGIESGANDYIRKPFSTKELLARIRSQLMEPARREEQIRQGNVLILMSSRKVKIHDVEIDFNRREFDIFACLARNAGNVLSRDQLIAAIAVGDAIVDRTIDSHLSHIRLKLKKNRIGDVNIRSVYGVGYKLEVG